MTLSAWVEYTATRKHNRKLVWGILSRLCNGELYAGFNQWNCAIKEMKELEGKLRKGNVKMDEQVAKRMLSAVER